MALVSVLLCVYNGREVLKESLDSVLAQTFRDFEFVIVDDGSNDGSSEVLEEYAAADSRIRLFTQRNAGLTRALNVGLARCDGKYIARQDADDLSEPERIARQVLFMEAHPEVLLSATDYRIIDDEGAVMVEVRNSRRRNLVRAMRSRNQLVHGTFMFRQQVDGQRVEFDEYYVKGQDYDLALRLMERGRIAVVPEVLYRWRFSRHGIVASDVDFYGRRALENHFRRMGGIAENKSQPETGEVRPRPSAWGFELARAERLLSGYDTAGARAGYVTALRDPEIAPEARRYARKRVLMTYAPRFLLRCARELL